MSFSFNFETCPNYALKLSKLSKNWSSYLVRNSSSLHMHFASCGVLNASLSHFLVSTGQSHVCCQTLISVLSQLSFRFFNRRQPIQQLSRSRLAVSNRSLPSEVPFHEVHHAPSLITTACYWGSVPGSGSSGSSRRFPFGDLLLAWV